MSAGIHVYVEYSFQSLCPGHGRTALIWRFVLSNSLSSALAPPGRCHQNPVLAVWSEYTMKSCEIDLRLWYQRG